MENKHYENAVISYYPHFIQGRPVPDLTVELNIVLGRPLQFLETPYLKNQQLLDPAIQLISNILNDTGFRFVYGLATKGSSCLATGSIWSGKPRGISCISDRKYAV